jgi:hypothetical protein
MNPRTLARLSVLAVASSLFAPTTSAATRCESGNLSFAEERACAKAAESTEALRRYVQRTRALHNLYVWDFVRREDAATAEVDARRAERDRAAKSQVVTR